MSAPTSQPAIAHLRGSPRLRPDGGLPRTFAETLRRTARTFPDKGISILDRSGRNPDRLTYDILVERVALAAGKLQAAGVKPGERILLCLPTSWDFIAVWLGSICLGAFPAAIAPAMGGLSGASNFAERLEKYRSVIGAGRILAPERLAQDLCEQHGSGLGAIALTLEELMAEEAKPVSFIEAGPDDLAFLQFTSGSTGMPRAVMITHGMATHNAFAINEGIGRRFGAPVSDWCELHSSWLPMHHDMGLIGCLLLSIANGLELSLMNPATFLARPIRYLETLSGKRAMMCGPNFGYQFCVDRLKPQDLEGLDLSKLAVAMTGSEMIRPETMAAFCGLMAPTGFTPDKVMPCYGMAEATLAVTFDGSGAGVTARPVPVAAKALVEAQEVVNCGVAVPDTEVRIADDDGTTLRESQLGEVLVKGPAVFKGYYKNDEATAASLSDGWLRTGDMGFVAEGQLYIAGRYKEILVIRGENLMPHEIEWLAEEARGETSGGERVAAFSVARSGQGEEIVLVVETNETEASVLKDLDHKIRSRIGRALSLPVSDLVFVRRGRIPRTSSGKIQRTKIKQDYLAGAVETLSF